jgi:hypothetical protein
LSVELNIDGVCLFIHDMNVLEDSFECILSLFLRLVAKLNHFLALGKFCLRTISETFIASACEKVLSGGAFVTRIF